MFGSGALSGLMLDLGLLKILCGGVYPISSPCGGGSNPAGPSPDPFPNLAGKAKLYLT